MHAPWDEAALERWYAKAVHGIAVPVDVLRIPTAFGLTQLLAAGSRDAPPLFLLPGLGTCAPVYAEAIAAFAATHRVYSVDIPGLPGKSDFSRIPAGDDGYARWLGELSDALGHRRAAFLGTSLGAFIVLKLAQHSPERIAKAVLVAPAGVAGASFVGVLRFVLAAVRFKRRPSRERARAMLQLLASRNAAVSETLVDLAELSFAHLAPDPATSRVLRPEALRGFAAPTLVLAGERDPIYAAPGLLRGAKRLLPHATAHVVPSMGHVPGVSQERAITELVRPFLRESSSAPSGEVAAG